MAAAKTALLFCTSVANGAVPFDPLHHMQAEQSIDTRNWAIFRAQTLKPFEEYGTALRIWNSTKNAELCAKLLKNVSNIWMCTAIKWPPQSVSCWEVFPYIVHGFHKWLSEVIPCRTLQSQWHTSSTSPLSHSLHVRSSLFNSCHLPISIWNAAIPPLNFNIILHSAVDFNNVRLDLTSHSVIRFIIDNFGFSCISFLH